MIVKNEENFIKNCLENALKFVDEAIIIDTGSKDKTKDIIRKFGDKVKLIEYPWENNFSEARNIGLKMATGDWILRLDADEKIIFNDIKKLKNILAETNYSGFKVPFHNMQDNGGVVTSQNIVLLYKNLGYRYTGVIHEQINIAGDKIGVIDEEICYVIHYGYMKDIIKNKNKIGRNISLLEDELKLTPDDPYISYQIGATYFNDEQYDKALDYFLECDRLSKGKGLREYHIQMFNYIASCLYNLKKYDQCIEFLDSILKNKFLYKYTDLHFTKAHCYLSLNRYKEAISNFKECVSIGECKEFVSDMGKGSYISKLMIARIYIKLNDTNNAVKWYIEGVFDKNNINKEGLVEFKKYLQDKGLKEILNELDNIM
jgi:glycosyltransferase involved in cell wall biosynthesis